MVGKYWFEKLARTAGGNPMWRRNCAIAIRSIPKDGAALFVSQSGETADTLAALRDAKAKGQTTIAVVNVAESSIAREADIVLPTYAGPEIGVASTKAFTCQLAALAAFAIAAGVARGRLSEDEEKKLCAALLEAPRHIAEFLKQEATIKALGEEIAKATRRLIYGPRPELSAGAGRRAEAQGNFLHPRRRLCRGRDEAWPHRADRREQCPSS